MPRMEWIWLTYNKYTNGLQIITTRSHKRPDTTVNVPLLNLNVADHAFVLDYQNDKQKFLSNFWSVVNW